MWRQASSDQSERHLKTVAAPRMLHHAVGYDSGCLFRTDLGWVNLNPLASLKTQDSNEYQRFYHNS